MLKNYKEPLAGCLATLRALRAHCSPSINIRHLEIVISIYLFPGITRKQLNELLPELSEPSLRKYINDLQNTSWRNNYSGASNVAQLNLVRVVENEKDSRYKHLYLTDIGQEMMKTIAEKMADGISCMEIKPNPEFKNEIKALC